ncbi:MAG TPA: hypothetical protein VN723_06975, partial [Rhizomicrobium sp.]|nr:hypothetical protein [Rhizomicrobium sp.]
MSTSGIFSGLDSLLLSYYQTQQAASPSAVAAANAVNTPSASANKSATAKDSPPWFTPITKSNAETAKILSTTNFLDT